MSNLDQRALPPPINGTEVYLAAIHRRLGDILDRLPVPAGAAEPQPTVELREPEPNVAGEKVTPAGRPRDGAKPKPAGGMGRGRPQAGTTGKESKATKPRGG